MTSQNGRCGHVDPGIPSVNHPQQPTVAPWRCAKVTGHEGGHAPVAVCQKTVVVGSRSWPCVFAIGHQGRCWPPVESRWLPKPLRECSREELIGAASLAFAQAELTERGAREAVQRAASWEDRVGRLAGHVLDGVRSPHGNRHVPDCWRRHPHCLAFAIIGSGGLESALADLDGERDQRMAKARAAKNGSPRESDTPTP